MVLTTQNMFSLEYCHMLLDDALIDYISSAQHIQNIFAVHLLEINVQHFWRGPTYISVK